MAHEVAVAFTRGPSALVESPNYKALAATTVPGRKNTLYVRVIFFELGFNVGPGIPLDAQGVQERLFRSQEAHREEHQLRRANHFGSGDFFRHELAPFAAFPLDLHRQHFFDSALVIPNETLGRCEVNARIIAELCGGFFLPVIQTIDLRPLRPGIVGRAILWWAWQNFEFDKAATAMSQGGPHAIGAGVAAANHP